MSNLNIHSKIEARLRTILGAAFDEDTEVRAEDRLTDLGVNSLMFARLIVGLEQDFGGDPFTSGKSSIVDVRTVGDLVDAYADLETDADAAVEGAA